MSNLVTYYGQTDLVNKLVDKYGQYLEQLDRRTKLLLRTILSYYVFRANSSLKETAEKIFTSLLIGAIPEELFDICLILEGITVDEAEGLLEALQHQLRWGNAKQ
ncbi:hypothetical protein [Nodularia sp. NIES-3585]|uniref:hypothetical protein n=1 Tax=Nodularia sp. NIES-3585 TaxID=1973477 RepID=UPI000B633B09|nr:hypothetical protein [Nodularia sp. NIES-3585]GAX38915.1 hypothetical protein NIES3585_49670 [Nodularia sp. NIES-3585]